MIFKHLSEAWTGVAPAVGNHLWQSTLLLLGAWALTLLLRHHQARARYWLWLAASLKFLVPFALLVDLGVELGTRLGMIAGAPHVSEAAQSGFSLAIDYMSRPFASAVKGVPAPLSAPTVHGHHELLLLLVGVLAVIWLCGFVAVLAVWCVRWRRIAAVVRQATPIKEGCVVTILQRLEKAGGIERPIKAVLSTGILEPGIFGIFQPVLVWPQGISEHLDDEHVQAILAHEICHVRRRDNLASAAHMLVEAIFWFHPLVWWMGNRLLEERERACDEQALELGNEPRVYAESILKTCEFCVGSPLACVSGVTGANLKERIVRIMANRGTRMLDLHRKILLGAAGLLTVFVPLGFGLTHASHLAGGGSDESAATLPTAKFEVASIRPAAPQNVHQVMMRIMNSPTDSRFYATNVTLKMLIETAYNIQSAQIEGGPNWLNSDHYDIQAKANSTVDAELKKLSPDEAKLVKERMLQDLLADRFHLKIKKQTKLMPVYALVVAKNGPKMQPSTVGAAKSDSNREGPSARYGGMMPGAQTGLAMMKMQAGGEMAFQMVDTSMQRLAQMLSMRLDRMVLDKTGLHGAYDFTLKWAPEAGEAPMMAGPGLPPSGAEPTPAPNSSGPSIFTALQDQLGLKLKSEKGPVEALEIESASQPTAN